MSRDKAKRSVEIRFSLFSLICLMACWLGITLLAFFLGSMVGRMQQMTETKHRYAVPEHVVLEEDLPVLTFDEALSEPDIILNPPPSPARDTEGRRTPKDLVSSSEKPLSTTSSDTSPAKIDQSKVAQKLDKPQDSGAKSKNRVDKPKDKEIRRVIQIASFHEKTRAESMVEKLKKRGYSAFLSISDPEAGGKAYFRVFVGPFSNMEEALTMKKKLEGRDKIKKTLIRQDTK